MPGVKILPAGDCAMSVEFGSEINEKVNGLVLALETALQKAEIKGLTETVPSYRSLLIYYNPCIMGYKEMEQVIKNFTASLDAAGSTPKRIIKIPVCYGGKYGEDLMDVAKHTGLAAEEVVHRHSSKDYLIYMLGFLPGFAYLGGLDKALATPRLQTPRKSIPAGSVAIGGEQTGVYPLASPGGWRLIGTTPVKPYDPTRQEPFLYKAGDYIRFFPVSEESFNLIKLQADNGEYTCEIVKRTDTDGN